MATVPRYQRISLCAHLGPATSETVQCAPERKCRARVFSCALHGRCTLGTMGMGVEHHCLTCPDRQLVLREPPSIPSPRRG